MVFSIVDILLLFLFYEIVLYTMKDFLNVNRWISTIWGIAMVACGVLVIIIEIPLAKRTSKNVWQAMSTNQRKFFGNDVSNLTRMRGLNAMYVGIFTIVIGALFLIIGTFLFLLDRDLKQSMVRPTKSTLPVIEPSIEKVIFRGFDLTQPEHDMHYMIISKKNEKRDEALALSKQKPVPKPEEPSKFEEQRKHQLEEERARSQAQQQYGRL